MGIGDLFTGQPLKTAAEQNRGILTQTGSNLINSTATARDQAGGILQDQYGLASGNLGTGYNAATGAINTGAAGAQGYLGAGNTAAQGTLQAGGGAYQPLTELAGRFGQGSGLYADALGINGASGNQNAQQAFQAGPGYEWQLNQGIDAINRRANAGGMLQGGNANRSAIDYATGLANKEYGGWLDRLGAYNNLELGATQGAAAGNQGNNLAIANLQNTGGQDQARVALGQGQNLAEIARDYYAKQAGADTGYGTAAAGNIVGANNTGVNIGMGLAPKIGQTYMDSANAEMQASKNQWTGLMDVAKLAVGAFGGVPGGGGGSTLGGWSLPGQSAASVKF